MCCLHYVGLSLVPAHMIISRILTHIFSLFCVICSIIFSQLALFLSHPLHAYCFSLSLSLSFSLTHSLSLSLDLYYFLSFLLLLSNKSISHCFQHFGSFPLLSAFYLLLPLGSGRPVSYSVISSNPTKACNYTDSVM